ncbi:hypothetical protein HELRODRAFT_171966 [Helobdella robusta]|uniref:UV excision repair protein RAD23 n=1 Tax=Helobdella robusta TaxID=6412 RepID=T1F4W6_HELRO|nr:hypothetical protein HELRODRAFT_171966 [Helobdella robusta]ESO04958.1 hypothetical protein HELRODRAFT_171966 [Helobdella robusta]
MEGGEQIYDEEQQELQRHRQIQQEPQIEQLHHHQQIPFDPDERRRDKRPNIDTSTPEHPFVTFQNSPIFPLIKDFLLETDQQQRTMNLIEQFRTTNPKLYSAIRADRERFLRLFGMNIDYEIIVRDLDNINRFFGTALHFTNEEFRDIESLIAMGYSQDECVQVYITCGRDVRAAALILTSQ